MVASVDGGSITYDAAVEIHGASGGITLSQVDIPEVNILFNRWALLPSTETASIVEGESCRGDRLVRIGPHDAAALKLNDAVELIKSLPRPLRMSFVRSTYSRRPPFLDDDEF